MKPIISPLLALGAAASLLILPSFADEEAELDLAQKLEKHQNGARQLADEQDELSADVQELIDEQTSEKVVELLSEVETIMADVIDNLDQTDTGGGTIAAETEIIEKIFEAAKQKAQEQSQEPQEGDPQEGEGNEDGQQPGGKPGEGQSTSGAMLDMMRRMMGENPDGDQQGNPDQEGKDGEGGEGGGGATGDTDKPNRKIDGSALGTSTKRRVPKKSGTAGAGLPPEFRKALDAYNRSNQP